ncbi:hypothetical protein T265_15388, partial [Opisthorchis viverrini]
MHIYISSFRRGIFNSFGTIVRFSAGESDWPGPGRRKRTTAQCWRSRSSGDRVSPLNAPPPAPPLMRSSAISFPAPTDVSADVLTPAPFSQTVFLVGGIISDSECGPKAVTLKWRSGLSAAMIPPATLART